MKKEKPNSGILEAFEKSLERKRVLLEEKCVIIQRLTARISLQNQQEEEVADVDRKGRT
jgi:hypothetical protein